MIAVAKRRRHALRLCIWIARALVIAAASLPAAVHSQVDDCTGQAPGTPCDDGEPCTINDRCDEYEECSGQNRPSGFACEDGDSCTLDDRCDDEGACVGGPARRPVGTPCGDQCTPGLCAMDEGEVVCVYDAKEPGTPCSDGNPCTVSDACDEDGLCVGAPMTCSDANACTANDYCAGGQCFAGTPTTCDDGNSCTDDSCHPTVGCTHVIAPMCLSPILGLLNDDTDVEAPRCDTAAVTVTRSIIKRGAAGASYDIKLKLTVRTAGLVDPATRDSVRVAVLQSSEGRIWESPTIPAGAPAWSAAKRGRRFTFTDRTGSIANGLTYLSIKASSLPGTYAVVAKVRVPTLLATLPTSSTHGVRVEIAGLCLQGSATTCAKVPGYEHCRSS